MISQIVYIISNKVIDAFNIRRIYLQKYISYFCLLLSIPQMLHFLLRIIKKELLNARIPSSILLEQVRDCFCIINLLRCFYRGEHRTLFYTRLPVTDREWQSLPWWGWAGTERSLPRCWQGWAPREESPQELEAESICQHPSTAFSFV